jgi:hypothetical protein
LRKNGCGCVYGEIHHIHDEKTRDLMDRLAEKHGTFICRKLIDHFELTTKD